MELNCDRLLLRPFRNGDAAAVAAYSATPDFIRFMPLPTQTLESAQHFVWQRVEQGSPAKADNWHFAIEERRSGTLIGSIRIGVREAAHFQGDGGYALNPSWCGKGLASEALSAILVFGFDHLGLERIWATADTENIASWRVMEKAGMVREGVMRHHRLVRGAWRDWVLYSKLRDEQAASSIHQRALRSLEKTRYTFQSIQCPRPSA